MATDSSSPAAVRPLQARAELTREVISPDALLAEVASVSGGAIVLFLGTVREVNDGRPVTGMEYSAYDAMAKTELLRIAEEALADTGALRLTVVHRTGTLALGDISVAIAVCHPHRAEAFAAARQVIEQIKQRVPIWKLEHYTDGTRDWVDPTARSAAKEEI